MILGFLEIPGLDTHEAALAGALMRGEHDEGKRFLEAVEAQVPSEVRGRMAHALELEGSVAGAGADFLVKRAPWMLTPPGTVEPLAAQDSRGNCCATDPWRWELNPKEWPYGRCGPEGCPTTGSISIEMVVNVFAFPEVSYDHFFREASGPDVRMESMSVKLKRDRSGGPDPTVADYDCPAGELPLSCQTDTRESGTGVEEYYYIATQFHGTPTGEPGWSFEFQSRRWKVGSNRDADFPAHSSGG
jgi:hypothetical protein